MAATWRVSNALTASALWFFSAGIAWVLTGSLNLLNRAYGADAPGLRWFCRGTNVFMLCFTALGGIVTNATASGLAIVVGLFAAVTILSWMRSSVGNARLKDLLLEMPLGGDDADFARPRDLGRKTDL